MEKNTGTHKPKNRTLRILAFYSLMLTSLSYVFKNFGDATNPPLFFGQVLGALILPFLFYQFLLKPKLNDGISIGTLSLAKKSMIGFVIGLIVISFAATSFFSVNNSDFVVNGNMYKNNVINFTKPPNLIAEVLQKNDGDTPYYIISLSDHDYNYFIFPTSLPPANREDNWQQEFLLGFCSSLELSTDNYTTCRTELNPYILTEKNSIDTSGNTIYEVVMKFEGENSENTIIFNHMKTTNDRAKSVNIMGTGRGSNVTPASVQTRTYEIINAVSFN